MFRTSQTTVGTSVTEVVTTDPDGTGVTISNGGSASVYIGESTVSSTTGYLLASGAQIHLDLGPGDGSVYARTASGSATLYIVKVRAG